MAGVLFPKKNTNTMKLSTNSRKTLALQASLAQGQPYLSRICQLSTCETVAFHMVIVWESHHERFDIFPTGKREDFAASFVKLCQCVVTDVIRCSGLVNFSRHIPWFFLANSLASHLRDTQKYDVSSSITHELVTVYHNGPGIWNRAYKGVY